MKPTQHCFQLLPVLAAGFLFSPICLRAQDAGAEPSKAPPPNEQPNAPAGRERPVFRPNAMHAQGRAMIAPDATADQQGPSAQHNPAVSPHQMPQPNPSAANQAPPTRPTGPWHPMAQPNQGDQPQQPMAPPNQGGQPHQPMAQPNQGSQPNMTARPSWFTPGGQPHQPMAQPNQGGQNRLMFQARSRGAWGPALGGNRNQGGQNSPMFQARMRGSWGPQVRHPQFAGQQQQMGRGNNQGGQNRMMFQARSRGAWGPQLGGNRMQGGQNRQLFQARMRGSWGPQMRHPQFARPQQQMGRGNNQGGQNRQLFQQRSRSAWGPQVAQPKAAAPQQRTTRPNAPQAQTKPTPAAENSPLAKIRHLRQAAEQLTAAGYPEYAAKARAEVSRMEAELKLTKPTAPPAINKETPRRDAAPQQIKPVAPRATDVNAAMLNEMRKLSKQIEQLNGRMQKLETQNAR